MSVRSVAGAVADPPRPYAVRLAVIDSDSRLLRALDKRLDRTSWQHRIFDTPVPVEDLRPMRLNAVVLDPAILGPRAWAYLEQLCMRLPDLGVVVCTGRSTVAQRVRGLRLGADDWVTKPCHPDELIARMEAVVRRRMRAPARTDITPLVAGELEIWADHSQAFVGGVSLDLTRREFELLQLLAEAEGQLLERGKIYERVWGHGMTHGDRSVDVFVARLRQKLGRCSPGWRYIHTHYGIGYRFQAEPVERGQP